MRTDIRDSKSFQEAEEIARVFLQPGTGLIVDALEVDVASNGLQAVIAGVILDKLEGGRTTRLCLVNLEDGSTKVLTFGPNSDRMCKFSPDAKHIAFLSDRDRHGDFQLYLLDPITGAARRAPIVDGWIEYLRWSENGTRILLGVAGHGADAAGSEGSVGSEKANSATDSWMPKVDAGNNCFRRRSAWVFDVGENSVRQIPTPHLNIWEANWCGESALIAVGSADVHEGAWYSATLHKIEIEHGQTQEIYQSANQMGWPAASPSGEQVALVEAVCSDRWCVAGDLVLLDMSTNKTTLVFTNGADICHTQWRTPDRLLLGAQRDCETLVIEYDIDKGELTEGWSSPVMGSAGLYFSPVPFGDVIGDCAFIAEGFRNAPHLALVERGTYRAVRSFSGLAESDIQTWVHRAEPVRWSAPDGLEIQGWLLLPEGPGPFPVVMHVHGGPVSSFRPNWLGRSGTGLTNTMLVKRGYAVFQPNPRGSSARGQDFARKVKGDINGADTHDYLSGLDTLVRRGIADPNRIGVTGVSYGGNMTCWLITQDQRFAAAVAIAPHSDQVSQHLLSNIPNFDELFIGGKYNDPSSKYYERSAIMYAHKTRTPTLILAGALDRCTPPTQAEEFYNALQMNSVTSALVIYPEEGHGIRRYPAVLDCSARVVDWFEEHMLSTKRHSGPIDG